MLNKLIEIMSDSSNLLHNFIHDNLLSYIFGLGGYFTASILIMSTHVEAAEKAGAGVVGAVVGVVVVTFYKALVEEDISNFLKKWKARRNKKNIGK